MENKRYLKKFANESEYNFQKDEVMNIPHVVLLNDTKEVIFTSDKTTPSDPFNGYEYVDLGLPSGTLWATAARNHNVPISVISQGMGHTSEQTTQIYLTMLENSVIDDANKGIISGLL